MKTYRLAKEMPFNLYAFGPVMTLCQAEYWRDEMAKAGRKVLIVNAATEIDLSLWSLDKAKNRH